LIRRGYLKLPVNEESPHSPAGGADTRHGLLRSPGPGDERETGRAEQRNVEWSLNWDPICMAQLAWRKIPVGWPRWGLVATIIWLTIWASLGAMSYRSPVYLLHRSAFMHHDGARLLVVRGVGVIQCISTSGSMRLGATRASFVRSYLEIEFPSGTRKFSCDARIGRAKPR